MSSSMGFLLKETKSETSQVWLGVTYAAAKDGQSAEATLGIGTVGLLQTTLWGSAGGPAGVALGAFFGL